MTSSKWVTTQYNHFQTAKAVLLDSYRHAKIFHMTCNEFVTERSAKVYETNSYKRLSQYYKGKLSGISDTLFEQIQTELVEWKHYYKNRAGRIVYVSRWEKMPKYIREGNLFSSNHFWKGTTKPWGRTAHGKGLTTE